MSLTVNSNLSSLNAQNAISSNQQGLTTAMQRLSTGLKINSAADNAAGYSISQRMTAQINGNTQAASNANDAISMTQTAQGDLSSITANLQQIRTLAVQAANGSNSPSDRTALNNQAQQLISEITRVANNSSFNGLNLLDGSFSATSFQIGANGNVNNSITISAIPNATASSLGVTTKTVTSLAVGTTATAGGLAAGDLTLNGIQIGASTAGSKPGQTTNSAVQMAAAINAVSAKSGVTATAVPTILTGSAATSFAAIPSTTAGLTINGVAVGNIAAGADAIGQGANVAAALNLVSSQSGVTATANSATGQVTLTAADGSDIAMGAGFTAVNSGLSGFSATQVTGSSASAHTAIVANTQGFTINGVQIGAVAAGTNATSQGDNVAAAINLVSSQSGVTATADPTTGALTLTNTSNGGITMGSAFSDGSTNIPQTGNVAGTATTGLISLASSSGGTIIVSGNNVAAAGLTAGQQTTTSQTNTLNNVSLNTSAGAASALSVIDGALNMVNTSSASLGAYQNRFTQTVSSLNSQNVNNTASRSRITDADFASETANLSRAQVLQQAGTAMLAQANQSAQGVLSLLR